MLFQNIILYLHYKYYIMPNRLLTYTIGANQPIIRRNLDAYSKAIDKMDARHEEAIKQKSALDVAFSQLEMNEAEDGWKMALRDKMQAEIDSAAMFGNYASAYDTAILSAGKLMSNPGVLGRIRANAEYNQYKKTVESRNDIDQTTKDRWLDENPYHYEDKFDENGNVIGGTSWTPNWNPVTKVDLTDIYTKVGQLAAAEAGGSENVQYLDENGNLVSDPAQGFYGMAYKKGTRYERLSEEKLKSMFDSIFRQYPNAMESLMQDRDNRIWEYNKTPDESKKNFIGSDIIKEDGSIKTPEDYLADRVNPVLKGMAYNRVYNTIDVGSAYAQRLQEQRAAAKLKASAQALYALEGMNTPAIGANIIFSGEEHAKQVYTGYQSAIEDIAKLFPRGIESKELQSRLGRGDYVGAGKLLRGWITNPQLKSQAQQAIARMIDSGSAFKQLTAGKSQEEIDAIAFSTAIENGARLPIGNRYTIQFNQELNKFLGSGSSIYIDGSNLGNVDAIARRYGGKVASDGSTIAIPRSKAAYVLNELGSSINFIGRPNKNTGKVDWVNINQINSASGSGVPVSASIVGGVQYTMQTLPSGFTGVIDAAKTKSKSSFDKNDVTEALSIDPHGNPNRHLGWQMYMNGQIDGPTFAKFDEHSEQMLKSAVLGAEFWQYPVYADKHNKDLRLVDAKDTERLRASLDNIGKDDLQIYACNTSHGYGTYVRIAPHKNTAGKQVDETVFFIQGLGDNKAANAVYQSPTGRASSYYNTISGFGGSYTTTDGETFEDINPKGGYYNGKFIDRNTIVKTMAASNQEEDVMQQIQEYADAGIPIDQSTIMTQVAALAQQYGYTPGTPQFEEYVNSRTYRILTMFDE